MRIAIASDIHGNKHAFEAVIAAAEAAEADELWCLGDLVGYGGDPDRSVELAIEHCAICLAGNHDLAVVDVLSLEDFSRGAALAAQWTKETIKPETREFLLSLSPEGGAEGVGLYHASPRDGDPRAAWLMLDTERWTAEWRRAEYDIAGAQAAIRAANLPDSLAERLQHGQ